MLKEPIFECYTHDRQRVTARKAKPCIVSEICVYFLFMYSSWKSTLFQITSFFYLAIHVSNIFLHFRY